MQLAFCVFKVFEFGGISRDLRKITHECLARGHDVRIYTLKWQTGEWNGEARNEARANEETQASRLEVVTADVRAFTNHERYARFAKWVAEHLERHPVDLVVGFNKMPGLDVYYAGDSCFEEKARTQRGWYYRMLPRYHRLAELERGVFGAEHLTKIFTIAPAQMPIFQQHYGTPEYRFFPLPPGIEKDRVASEDADVRAELRREFQLADDDLLLLFIGSGFVKKGLDRVLNGLAALPAELARRTWLFVLGEDKRRAFEKMARRLKVDRVRFLGGRDDVPRFLFGADAFVLPAYDEAAGIAIVEALVAGLPALVTSNCGYAPYVTEAGAGLVAQLPFRQESFDAQLVELLTSAKRSEWMAAGRKLAADPRLFRLVETAVELIEQFARGDVQPIVAFCMHEYFPQGTGQRDFMRIAKHCLELGIHVRVYCLRWQGDVPAGFEVVVVPVASMTRYKRYDRFDQWVNRALQRNPAHCVVGFDRMHGLDIYYAADGCFEERTQRMRTRMYRNSPHYQYHSSVDAAAFGADTEVLVLSRAQKAAVIDARGVDSDAVTVLPPAVDRPRVDVVAARADLRARDGLLENGGLALLFVGESLVSDGLGCVVSALARLPDALKERCRLTAIGGDHSGYARMLDAMQLGKAVRLLPLSTPLEAHLLKADLLLEPGIPGRPNGVVLTALAHGLPVVTTTDCAYSEVIEASGAGCVLAAPFRQETFVDAMVHALCHPQQRHSWRESALRFGRDLDPQAMPRTV
ncbi:MAG: glycosyltransferase family 4 protein, partial [Gammaproteobacteria bacterium]|nr:glycosyltransferase family 4 protein [Gammaproteobacteria bacterium]